MIHNHDDGPVKGRGEGESGLLTRKSLSRSHLWSWNAWNAASSLWTAGWGSRGADSAMVVERGFLEDS